MLAEDTLSGVPVGFGRYVANAAMLITEHGAGRLVYGGGAEGDDSTTVSTAAVATVAATAAATMRARRLVCRSRSCQCRNGRFGTDGGDASDSADSAGGDSGSGEGAAFPGAPVLESSDTAHVP